MAPLSDDTALQFAIMLQAGLPPSQAIQYFIEARDPVELGQELQRWLKSTAVRRAQKQVMGKGWTEMTLDERISYALNQHYSSLAYLLFSTNYVDATQADKGKLDSARVALEQKVAGQAGKGDALSRFFDDLQSGRLKLASVPVAPLKAN